MAEIIPFKAWRYNDDFSFEIDQLTSPLFDVVSKDLLAKLYANQYNSIHLSVPQSTHPAAEAFNTLERWKEQGVIKQDDKPAIYVYYQYFTLDGDEKQYCRKGFICNIRVYNWDEKVILRHENTIPSSVNDRTALLEQTELNVSPTHGLYSDPKFFLEKYMDDAIVHPLYEATDYQGVRDVLAAITDENVIRLFTNHLKDKKVILADGHHRYEGSLFYKKKMINKTGGDEQKGYNYHLMYLTNADSDDIKILATHRLLVSLPDFDEHRFIEQLEKYFNVQLFDRNVNRMTRSISGLKGMLGIILPSYCLLIKLKEEHHNSISWHFPEQIKKLDLTILHYFIIEKILMIPGREQRSSDKIKFERDALNCKAMVENGEADLAILTNPVTMEEIKKVCFSGYTLPQKSTYFYPKVVTGFVFSSIKENEFTPHNISV